ncbi:MAG: hypothetical protein R3D66_03010 [Alphaproteobacteria bacterium]
MWTSFGALGKGKTGCAQLGEQLRSVADLNRCEYCLAAHTLLGQKAGVGNRIWPQRRRAFFDPKTQAALDFAREDRQGPCGHFQNRCRGGSGLPVSATNIAGFSRMSR